MSRDVALPSCALPCSDAIVAEACIVDVLSEVVDGRYAYLSRESVIDLGDKVVYRLFDKRLKISCVHDEIFLVFCLEYMKKFHNFEAWEI